MVPRPVPGWQIRFRSDAFFGSLPRMAIVMRRTHSAAPFIAAVAVSSAALFMVQPMAARMLLPSFGGAPSVWTTCMLFFQAGLLAGYLHAHASGWVGLRAHAILHIA